MADGGWRMADGGWRMIQMYNPRYQHDIDSVEDEKHSR